MVSPSRQGMAHGLKTHRQYQIYSMLSTDSFQRACLTPLTCLKDWGGAGGSCVRVSALGPVVIADLHAHKRQQEQSVDVSNC